MMKNIQKLVLISLLIFVFSTIGMTCLYFLVHRFAAVYNLKYITTVITQVGMIAAIIPSMIFLLIYSLIKILKSKWLLSFLILVLFVFLILVIFQISLVMVFYHLDDTKSFLKSLIEIF
jgi:hypothetical protein